MCGSLRKMFRNITRLDTCTSEINTIILGAHFHFYEKCDIVGTDIKLHSFLCEKRE